MLKTYLLYYTLNVIHYTQLLTFELDNYLHLTFQLAEIISVESSLKEENRKMSIIIAEAEEVLSN